MQTGADTPIPLLELSDIGGQDAPVADGATFAPRDERTLGQILLDEGAVESRDLMRAVILQERHKLRLGEILLARGWVTDRALAHALSRQWRISIVDLAATPPDPRLIDQIGAEHCLTYAMVPWRRVGGTTFLACAQPDRFDEMRAALPEDYGPVRMLLTTEAEIQTAILNLRRTNLIRRAEQRVSPDLSCRTMNESRTGRMAAGVIAAVVLLLALWPVAVIALLTAWAALTLVANSTLKILAFRAALRDRVVRDGLETAERIGLVQRPEMEAPLPVISVMVPLFREHDIAERLVSRLTRLTYPRELTDILLVVEENDEMTHRALEGADLPKWMRVIVVPEGPIKTKPRALNYALNFCRGEIIGIWDAEDQPEPDQLDKVAYRFHFAPRDVVCLQAALDYYNPRTNWMARCFTIEYASWFRAVLPGMSRMGLVVPLGGTSLFIQRRALEKLGAWDAWNVTEDADLGARIARFGWRTEMIDSTTHEEANCRAKPWIKQRSRWLKGHALTWGVHMRDPRQLLTDLGWKRFLAFQIQFFGAVTQFLLAPVLWSFWLLSLGFPHPLRETLTGLWGGNAVPVLFTLFVGSELLSIAVSLWAVRGRDHRHLMFWVPTAHFYFPLGCLAGWKAIYEVVVKPFYWDKTMHGIFEAGSSDAAPGLLPGLANVPLLGRLVERPASEKRGGQQARPAAGSGPQLVGTAEVVPVEEIPVPRRLVG